MQQLKVPAILIETRRRLLVAPIAACLGLASLTWATKVHADQAAFMRWADTKRAELKGVQAEFETERMRLDEPVLISRPHEVLREPDVDERARNDATRALYARSIGSAFLKGMLWTGIESADPLTRTEDYRWDSIADQGLYDPVRRQKLIAELKRLGIVNVRVGLSNHRIDPDDEASWRDQDGLIRDLSDAGLNIDLDLQHFGIESRFRVVGADGETDGPRSYYLNPAWPDYFAHFAAKAFARYHSQVKAITLINEPETTVGFNSEMWHGAFPGWDSPMHNFYYVERAVQVAKAAIQARIAIQAQLRKADTRVLFIHPEAAVFKPYWTDFNRFVRFFVGDLMLGQKWLVEADLDEMSQRPMNEIVGAWQRKAPESRTSLDWVIETYIVRFQPEQKREKNRDRLVKLLKDVRELHRRLHREFDVTMLTDTVFGVDYYAQNEDRDARGHQLSVQPQNYAQEVTIGRRRGLYSVLLDYYDRYRLPMMITETGTPFYAYGVRWHEQMLLACAKAMARGVPFLGYSIYPAVDTWGWESALSVAKPKAKLNPSGILDSNLGPRDFAQRLISSLTEVPASVAQAALKPNPSTPQDVAVP